MFDRTSTIRRGHEFVMQMNRDLVKQVRHERAQGHVGEGFYTSDRRGRKVSAKILPDDDLYVRMMAAKGCRVRVGEV